MKKNKNMKTTEKKEAYSINDSKPIEKEKGFLNPESESGKFVIILLVIISFIVLLWIVDSLKNSKGDEIEETEISIDYSEVIVGNMLNQKHDEYYVIAYQEEENRKDLIDYLISTKVGANYYVLDLTRAYNLPSVAETSNFTASSINEIKFKGTTLLKIKNNKIEKAYEGADTIVDYLRNLNKKNK